MLPASSNRLRKQQQVTFWLGNWRLIAHLVELSAKMARLTGEYLHKMEETQLERREDIMVAPCNLVKMMIDIQ
jgi:hypothetical protein